MNFFFVLSFADRIEVKEPLTKENETTPRSMITEQKSCSAILFAEISP